LSYRFILNVSNSTFDAIFIVSLSLISLIPFPTSSIYFESSSDISFGFTNASIDETLRIIERYDLGLM